MRRAPLLVPAAAMLLAILADQHAWTYAPLAAAFVCATAFFEHGHTWRLCTVRAASIALLGGVLVSTWRGHPAVIDTERATARYTATVIGDVRDTDTGAHSTALAIASFGTLRATLREPVEPGLRIVVRGRIEPFDEPRNPGEPSMRDIERDAGFSGRLASARIVARLASDPWDTRAWAARLRARASARIHACIPEPSATILAGALWGERGTLPDDLHDAFQATGTVHVLVTAGLHLGIIAALLAFGMAALGIHRVPACATAFVLVVGYAWFSGAHLPSERAAAMIGVALLARACGSRAGSWNALAVAAIVVAILWPAAVGSASFALSFSCLASIVLFAGPIASLLERLPLHERIREAVALTCAAQLGTWPLTASIFSVLAPYALLANALVVPLMGVVIPLGLLTLAYAGAAPAETLLLQTVEHIVRTLAIAPGATATIASPSAFSIAGYDALAIGCALALRAHRRRRAALVFIAACALVVLPGAIRLRHGLEITHLDVGQADAAVIRTPSDRIILIDAGGALERPGGHISNAERAGARIVLGYLHRQGISKIDLMILTHPHGDHVGSAAPIIEAMSVGMIFDSGQSYPGRAYHDAMTAAQRRRVPVIIAQRGMRWDSGDGVTFDVLAPSRSFLADTGDDVNENSIVVMLRAHGFRELFMGDAGEASEAQLLANRSDLHANVVKVGHHGSRYASTSAFVAAVHPRIAVISVGRHNTFGHPAPATIESWSGGGAAVLRTDHCGAISLTEELPATMLPLQCDHSTF